MAAPLSFSRWFGSVFLLDKPCSQGSLTLLKIREDRLDVKVVFRRKLFANPVDLRNDGIFPHHTILP